MRGLKCLSCVVVVGSAAFGAEKPVSVRIDPDNPPKGTFADDWYAVTFQGSKCGHMHSTVTRRSDSARGEDVIETRTELQISLGRGGQSIRIGTIEKSTETIPGGIIGFTSETNMSLLSMKVTGRVAGDKVTVSTTQFGQSTTKTYPLPQGALMTWGLYREQVKRGLEVGAKYALSTYAPSMTADRALETSFEVVGREKVDLYGRIVDAYKTRQAMKAPGLIGQMSIESIVWMDERFVPLKLEMSVADMRIVAIHCDRAIATKEGDPPEMMAETLIPLKLPAGAEQARSITYRVTRGGKGASRPSGAPISLPETPMQRVDRTGTGTIVKVTRSGSLPSDAARSKPDEAELEKLREATSYVNIDDPEIRRLAKEAAGEEKDPPKLVRRLRAFVSDYVESKDLSIGFATASEVARSKQGDCSEHAVLLAALARACGLPARGVSGVVFASRFAGRSNVLVWHMWAQVWVGNRWVDADPALEQDDLDATHIAMGLVPFSDAGLAEMAMPIWNLIGQVKIEVVDVEKAPGG